MKSEFDEKRDLVLQNRFFQIKKTGFKEIRYAVETVTNAVKDSASSRAYRCCQQITYELLNNVFRNGLLDEKINFAVAITSDKLLFLCESKMYLKYANKLLNNIEYLNTISNNKEVLKRYFKDQLFEAHLGMPISNTWLTNIVLKSREKLLYDFSEIDVDIYNVSIIVSLPIK